VHAWLAKQRTGSAPTRSRTTAAVLPVGLGFHRCVDYLVTDADLDAQRIAAVGHSRNGKTALLAGAFDDASLWPSHTRPAAAAPRRAAQDRRVGEADQHQLPHWFNAEFKKFNDQPISCRSTSIASSR